MCAHHRLFTKNQVDKKAGLLNFRKQKLRELHKKGLLDRRVKYSLRFPVAEFFLGTCSWADQVLLFAPLHPV